MVNVMEGGGCQVEEHVLCFRRELVPGHLSEAGVFHDDSLWRKISRRLVALPRSAAEKDYRFKQLVVYVVIRSENLYLTYKRTRDTYKGILREHYSIGIGGHVNPIDYGGMDAPEQYAIRMLRRAVAREIEEEVHIGATVLAGPRMVCLINDDSHDVGRVHFGTVWLAEISAPEACVTGEPGIGEIEFCTLAELRDRRTAFEPWSRLLIDYLWGEVIDRGSAGPDP
jgi:predicted NUDIX family phosphoesterase